MKKLLNIAILLAAIPLCGCGIKTVEQGNTGVKKTMGKVDSEPLTAGFYTYNPFVSSVIEMDNHVQKFEDKANVYTKDVQSADIEFTINYALKPEYSVKVYSTVGEDWEKVLIPQVISGAMKNAIGKWNAIELVSNRDKAAEEIKDSIGNELADNGIVVTGFQLTNVKFNDEFEKAVEDKVIAVQKAEQAKNETVQVKEQANQRVIAANADAEAMKIKSDALSKNKGLIAYEAVQKWNGVMPQIVTGSASSFLMQLPKQDDTQEDKTNP